MPIKRTDYCETSVFYLSTELQFQRHGLQSLETENGVNEFSLVIGTNVCRERGWVSKLQWHRHFIILAIDTRVYRLKSNRIESIEFSMGLSLFQEIKMPSTYCL